MRKRLVYNIEINTTCNLVCPSCPNGYVSQWRRGQRMSVELYERILSKAQSESDIEAIYLYVWNEPLLHPELPEILQLSAERGVRPSLSTNLNLIPKWMREVLSADPTSIRISMSGFKQDTYGITHAGGDADEVKKNMGILADLHEEVGSRTSIEVLFHRYAHNLADEAPLRDFAQKLGFSFSSIWGIIMPIEKNLEMIQQETVAQESEPAKSLSGLVLLNSRDILPQLQHNPSTNCSLLDDQVTIDAAGNTVLCCAVSDFDQGRISSFVDTSLEEIVGLKSRHDLCGPCMSNGLHDFVTYSGGKFDEFALQRLGDLATEGVADAKEVIRFLTDTATSLSKQNETLQSACDERLHVIEELATAADERGVLVERLDAECTSLRKHIGELEAGRPNES
ncbi:MAG: radical SAM protein [Candidatus Latescibacteria bacterium]|jgi:MoaA/NifB/PqqE/SkfB family radical SAM enzyme|nr:radical SAM protein [Gemmatimonadota bacterium]MBT5873654.1 radical SAM protein [Candidatus Latescibacterota bacterium]